jgi:hypothetical protein
MTDEELRKAHELAGNQRVTLTLYTGTDDFDFANKLVTKHLFDTKFTETYCPQKQGSRGKFKANYGPGIYLSNNLEEARFYGQFFIKFVCTGTPFLDATGSAFTVWRKALDIKGGPQAVMSEKNLSALLLVAAGPTSYYTLRTATGVEPSRM